NSASSIIPSTESPSWLTPHALGYSVRLRVGNGARRRLVILLQDRRQALQLAKELRHIAHILVTSGHADLAERFVAVGAAEGPERVRGIKARAIAVSLGRATPLKRQDSSVTFGELAERWTSGRLHQTFPHHIREKKSVSDGISRFKRLTPIVGEIPLTKFSLQDAQRAMQRLPIEFCPATRRHYAQLIASVLKLAVFPCGIIATSPLPSGWLPRVQIAQSKSRTILYPDEEVQLLRCADVLLG